jgi:hypothetical protein
MSSEELRKLVEKIRKTSKQKNWAERRAQRLKWLRNNKLCAKCGKKIYLGESCRNFSLAKCEICGRYFCCRHIMLFPGKLAPEGESIGICQDCWTASPETENVKDEWKSAHVTEDHQQKDDCFIATAVLTTTSSPALANTTLQDLRAFRDNWLKNRAWGRMAVKLYYKVSPPVAERMKGRKALCNLYHSLFVGPMHRLVTTKRTPALSHWLAIPIGILMVFLAIIVTPFTRRTFQSRYQK